MYYLNVIFVKFSTVWSISQSVFFYFYNGLSSKVTVADSNHRCLHSPVVFVLAAVHCWQLGSAFTVTGSCLFNSLLPLVTSARTMFIVTASKLISFPDHFIPNSFRFLVLFTIYSSGLAVLDLGHSK